jgi:hypothetical protein
MTPKRAGVLPHLADFGHATRNALRFGPRSPAAEMKDPALAATKAASVKASKKALGDLAATAKRFEKDPEAKGSTPTNK